MGWPMVVFYFLFFIVLVDSRELVDLSVFGLQGAQVLLSRYTTDQASWDWRTPWNILLLGCGSPDR